MGCVCKGICERDKNTHTSKRVYYDYGYKRCQVCQAAIKTELLRCYCCNSLIRNKVQNGKYRLRRIADVARY